MVDAAVAKFVKSYDDYVTMPKLVGEEVGSYPVVPEEQSEEHRKLFRMSGGLAPEEAIGLAAAIPHEQVPKVLAKLLLPDHDFLERFRKQRAKALPGDAAGAITLDDAIAR